MSELNAVVLIPGLRVRNKKNKNIYEVIGKALNCTNDRDGELMIIYKKPDDSLVFAREVNEFIEKFEFE